MKPFSKKINADLKEYSNQVTKQVNDYIVSHPNVMNAVIKASQSVENEDELYFWMKEVLQKNSDIHIIDMESASTTELIKWGELAYAWFNTVKRDIPLPGDATFEIEKLPVLDKKKKLDELLDSLSKETDPTKQEQIKQHITRIKNAKLLKARYGDEAICNYCGKWQPTDLTPQQLEEIDWKCDECKAKEPKSQEVVPPENREQKQISKFDPEYEFLKKLINIIGKVAPEALPDIKSLTQSQPFVTVDDAGNLAAKIWTLAVEKYNIPREWLIKKLPEKKINSDLRDDEWPAQRAAEDFGMRPWNETAYESWKNTEASKDKKASPETDHALFISMGEDVIREYFFEKGIRWSQVVKFIKDQVPQLTDEDIVNLKTDTKYRLEQYRIQVESNKKEAASVIDVRGKRVYRNPTDQQIKSLFQRAKYHSLRGLIDPLTADFYVWDANDLLHDWVAKDLGIDIYNLSQAVDDYLWFDQNEEGISYLHDKINEAKEVRVTSKKKGLSLADALKILENKGPKPVHVDYKDLTVELENGSKLSFDEVTRKALELSKSSSAESEEQERNKDAGTGFYDSPNNYDMGKRPQGDEFIWPADTWLPRGTEEQESQDPTNVMSSKKLLSRKAFLKISKPKSGYVDNGVGYTCGRCEYFNPEKERCKLVEGTIKSFGCCNFWDGEGKFKEKNKVASETKGSDRALTKEESVYIEYPNVDYRCDECVFFDAKAKTCTKVEGEISPTASCNLWQPISKKQSSLNKKAYIEEAWVAPDGKVYPTGAEHHDEWIALNTDILESYGYSNDELESLNHLNLEDLSMEDDALIGYWFERLIRDGWVRLNSGSGKAQFVIHVNDMTHLPASVDEIVAEYFDPNDKRPIEIGTHERHISIYEPFPTMQQAVNRTLRQSINAFSKKEINKVANPPSRYWIAPDGKEFPVAGVHSSWLLNQGKNVLPQYGIVVKNKGDIQSALGAMLDQGWIRVSNEPAGQGFIIELTDLKNIPSFLDNFISEYFEKGDEIIIGSYGNRVGITDPFPSIQNAVNKALRNPVNANLKVKADISGQVINEILKGIEANGGITYNISQGNLAGTDTYAVSIYPDRELVLDGPIDFDKLEGYIVENESLLNDPKNSFGAWTSGGKVYLDVIVTVPNKEEALRLAHENQQLAIFDLKNMQEIPVGIPAFSKKELNIVKEAEEQILTQEQQDQIAASTSPVYNIALNNFAAAVKRGHDKDRSLAYALDSVKNLEKLDPKKLVELANTYLKGLV